MRQCHHHRGFQYYYWRHSSWKSDTSIQSIQFDQRTNMFQSNNPIQIDLKVTDQKIMYKFSKTFETSLSDHHKLILGSFKSIPRIKLCRSYKSFSIDNFKNIQNQKLNNLSNTTYHDFGKTKLKTKNNKKRNYKNWVVCIIGGTRPKISK